jgi:sugar phosphate isomerase/epimerase
MICARLMFDVVVSDNMALTDPVGVQMYSGRKFPPIEAQFETIARSGFTNIETFGPLYDDVEATKRMLDTHGLTAKSGHFSVAMAESESRKVVEIAKRLSIEVVVAPYLMPAERPATLEGWKKMGTRLVAIGERFSTAGLRFAWHNHDFEFLPLPDGSLPIEHVLGDRLLWEADLAWMIRGGADPRRWIERYRGRIPLVHVKDIAPAGERKDEDGWADVGTGTVPWAELWPLCVAAGAEIMVAEHDNPNDFGRFARVSAAAMLAYAGKDQ